MKEKELKLPEGVSAEQVKAWKEKFGEDKVKAALLPMDENSNEYLHIIVKVPNRKEIAEYEKWIDRSPDKAKDILINACVLSEKEKVKSDDGLYFGAFDAISKLIPVRTAIIKNL